MFFILFSDVTYSVGYKISRIPTNVMKRKQKYKMLLDVTIYQIWKSFHNVSTVTSIYNIIKNNISYSYGIFAKKVTVATRDFLLDYVKYIVFFFYYPIYCWTKSFGTNNAELILIHSNDIETACSQWRLSVIYLHHTKMNGGSFYCESIYRSFIPGWWY